MSNRAYALMSALIAVTFTVFGVLVLGLSWPVSLLIGGLPPAAHGLAVLARPEAPNPRSEAPNPRSEKAEPPPRASSRTPGPRSGPHRSGDPAGHPPPGERPIG
ncbi:hypothetical protein Acsp01_32330 [Actinoplanes sp. NBRC 101535]|nr:hypothetical protein Acsp01_32330 [Actinoplanes sp. NBRC 101535]